MLRNANRVVIVGGGKMGEAILSGWLASRSGAAAAFTAESFTVVNPGEERRAYLTKRYDVVCAGDVSQLDTAPDLVVLAVKPQIMFSVLGALEPLPAFAGGASGPLFVSIAAGLTTDALLGALPEGAPLVRVMPNMPLSIGAGASGVCASATSSPEQVAYVADLFGCLGKAVVVDEGDIDTVCAVSGSGPAYVAAMIEALRDAAAAQGLDAELAEALALQTVLGTARLIDVTGVSPEEARVSICSPGGTTLAALEAMHAEGFEKAFQAGVNAAVARSKELAQCT